MKKIIASALVCCSFAVQAEPETTPADTQTADTDVFEIMVSAGITFGGEDLISSTDGDMSISSGGLIYFSAGGVYHISPKFDMQAAFAYHFDSKDADNGTAEFTRTSIEIVPFYVTDSGNRFGIGFTQVMSPEFTSPFESVTFDDASGLIIEYDWSLSSNSSGVMDRSYIGLRYANLSFEKENYVFDFDGDGIYEDSVDGSYIGLIIQGNF